jgi:hypothetical protein
MTPSPERILDLKRGEIFVFGSNLAGRHGAGAAKQALEFGARYGIGEGLAGRTYALPTKGRGQPLPVLSLKEISHHVRVFLGYATRHPEMTFLVTEIGCGKAGYTPAQIAPIFFAEAIPNNVRLPARFIAHAPPALKPLTRCQAARSDGECFHKLCPQLRDCEPEKSNRSCPLPGWGDDDET